MICNSNLLCLVGTGKSKTYPLNKLIIWDELQGKEVCNLTYNFYILSVKINSDK